jgi:hypothetical protein
VTIPELSAMLDRERIPHAVIGAVALAVHGVVRASDDVDVLVTDRRCLDPDLWASCERQGDVVEIRPGDADDPLAGVVRLSTATQTRIDVVVGRSAWQADAIARARVVPLLGGHVPVATAADLVLLKLYAGGPQDAWDIHQILDAVPGLEAEVTSAVDALPCESQALWRRIEESRATA